jgi:hypothetical protein
MHSACRRARWSWRACAHEAGKAARRPSGDRVGAISLAAPGERSAAMPGPSRWTAQGATALVADGLGHGPDAAERPQAALDVFRKTPLAEPPVAGTHACGGCAPRGGAAMCCRPTRPRTIRAVPAPATSSAGCLGHQRPHLLSQHGTAGVTIRTPEEAARLAGACAAGGVQRRHR